MNLPGRLNARLDVSLQLSMPPEDPRAARIAHWLRGIADRIERGNRSRAERAAAVAPAGATAGEAPTPAPPP